MVEQAEGYWEERVAWRAGKQKKRLRGTGFKYGAVEILGKR